MSIGLDLGTSEFRSLRCRRQRLIARAVPACYCVVSDGPAQRELVAGMHANYAEGEGCLFLTGAQTRSLAALLHVPCASLLRAGSVPRDDPPARQLAATFVEALLPPPEEGGNVCCLACAGAADDELAHSVAFVERVVRLRGYRTTSIGTAAALVLSELNRDGYSGLGMAFGAGCCQIALCHHGREVAHCTLSRGGDDLDSDIARLEGRYFFDAAGARFPDATTVKEWKERFDGSLMEPAGPREQLLADLYRQLIAELLQTAAERFAAISLVASLPQPLPIVCGGGPTRIRGFAEMLEQTLRYAPLPMEVGPVPLVADSPYAIARGALIAAELESQPLVDSRVA